jgi:hypothetical protein
MNRDDPRPPLCGATHLGDCVADLAVYELYGDPEYTTCRYWSWLIGASRGKVYARREDAIAAVREYIAMKVEEMEMRATAAQEQAEGP